ncbi:MAG TPA: glutathione S-transferase C-terminal domain-containing protein [Caulobacteraceae bacterium]
MIELYYYPGNASLFPHMLLREIGCAFTLRLVDRAHNAQASGAYLKLNPNGRIPVLVDDGHAVFETAAIGLYLADRFAECGLAPPLAAASRADYYRWMVYLANTPQAEFRAWFYPHEFVDDPELADHAKAAAGAKLKRIFETIAAQLGEGPWLLGERFSAADLFLLMMVRWGRTLPLPARDLPQLGAHTERVLGRAAVQATLAAEGLSAPFV